MGSHGWMKSLQCKSRALEDVALINNHHPKHHLLSTSTCLRTAQTLKDVVVPPSEPKHKRTPRPRPSTKQKPQRKQYQKTTHIIGRDASEQTLTSFTELPNKPNVITTTTSTNSRGHNASDQTLTSLNELPKPKQYKKTTSTTITTTMNTRSQNASDQTLTSLTELPPGHPSRNVVEIIFHTSWGCSYYSKSFPGRVDLVFKVHNPQRTVSRFEDYRLKVRSSLGGTSAEEDARCAADGNEMMRFLCLGLSSGDYGGAWGLPKGVGLCTFSGSGRAHERGGGGERGRRAMLVCRVIAGRVSNMVGMEGVAGFDSASGDNGELVVFDPRAVLPCFLVIYKL